MSQNWEELWHVSPPIMRQVLGIARCLTTPLLPPEQIRLIELLWSHPHVIKIHKTRLKLAVHVRRSNGLD